MQKITGPKPVDTNTVHFLSFQERTLKSIGQNTILYCCSKLLKKSFPVKRCRKEIIIINLGFGTNKTKCIRGSRITSLFYFLQFVIIKLTCPE